MSVCVHERPSSADSVCVGFHVVSGDYNVVQVPWDVQHLLDLLDGNMAGQYISQVISLGFPLVMRYRVLRRTRAWKRAWRVWRLSRRESIPPCVSSWGGADLK